jgi:hypothetical protein
MTWQSDRRPTDSPARPKKAIERQIRSLVRYVDLVGSRRIWPAQVGCVVNPDGLRVTRRIVWMINRMIKQSRLMSRDGSSTRFGA